MKCMSVLLGPVLQFRGCSDPDYNVSALVVTPLDSPSPKVTKDAGLNAGKPVPLADIPLLNPRYRVWRIDLKAAQGASKKTFNLSIDEQPASFEVPARGQAPRMAYASCNGFSDPKLMDKVDKKNDRWDDMATAHARKPYQLLLMGGDQVYSDEMRGRVKSMKDWFGKSMAGRIAATFTKGIESDLDTFFTTLYMERWKQPEPARMFAAIPSIMMWDDHDIVDGWGSYDEGLHTCAVFQGLFRTARLYFRIFQQQLITQPAAQPSPDAHPCQIAGIADGFHLGFKDLGGLSILVPDLRTERHPDLKRGGFTPTRIISAQSWDAIFAWLDKVEGHRHLLVMSSIPVGYLDLQAAEKALDLLPGQQELEDDLRDHWRSLPHRDERKRLIMRLLDYASSTGGCKVTLVSGDVHVAGACAIESTLQQHSVGGAGVIKQLISTGVVHPSPPALAVYFLESLGAGQEQIDYKITGTMLPIGTRGRYLIPARNWMAIEPDENDPRARLWINWHVEGLDHLVTQVIDPVVKTAP